jgi:hypothetical protein
MSPQDQTFVIAGASLAGAKAPRRYARRASTARSS